MYAYNLDSLEISRNSQQIWISFIDFQINYLPHNLPVVFDVTLPPGVCKDG